jgi:hypothetical protein
MPWIMAKGRAERLFHIRIHHGDAAFAQRGLQLGAAQLVFQLGQRDGTHVRRSGAATVTMSMGSISMPVSAAAVATAALDCKAPPLACRAPAELSSTTAANRAFIIFFITAIVTASTGRQRR